MKMSRTGYVQPRFQVNNDRVLTTMTKKTFENAADFCAYKQRKAAGAMP